MDTAVTVLSAVAITQLLVIGGMAYGLYRLGLSTVLAGKAKDAGDYVRAKAALNASDAMQAHLAKFKPMGDNKVNDLVIKTPDGQTLKPR